MSLRGWNCCTYRHFAIVCTPKHCIACSPLRSNLECRSCFALPVPASLRMAIGGGWSGRGTCHTNPYPCHDLIELTYWYETKKSVCKESKTKPKYYRRPYLALPHAMVQSKQKNSKSTSLGTFACVLLLFFLTRKAMVAEWRCSFKKLCNCARVGVWGMWEVWTAAFMAQCC